MKKILTIRPHSGLSGDILLAGLAVLLADELGMEVTGADFTSLLNGLCTDILPHLAAAVQIRMTEVHGIAGWQSQINLPSEHEHRHLSDIVRIILKSRLTAAAQASAQRSFEILAECESSVHGIPANKVHFHEVGALDSILDICVCCALLDRLGDTKVTCAPLPMADGHIECAHGILPAPAPAVLRLLEDVPVCPFEGSSLAGELVTPTALALLKAWGTEFGAWPSFTPAHTTLVYGSKIFTNAPNGVIFAIGRSIQEAP